MQLDPALKSISFAYFVAMEKLIGKDLMKGDAKAKLLKYHEDQNQQLPRIAQET